MKTALSLCLALAVVTSARAEIFRGGVGYSHWGHHNRTTVHVGVGHGYGYGPGYGYYGRGWDYGYYSPYRYYAPSYGYYDSYYPGYGADYPYYSGYGTGSYAGNGLLLGALAGGIIGNNSGEFHHNGWRGAAWGAGLGWLLGTVADANRRPVYATAPVYAQPAVVQAQTQAQPAQTQPQQVTIINNYYNASTPMSGANSLFGR